MGLSRFLFRRNRRTTNSADNSSTATVNVQANQQDFYYKLGSDMSIIAKNSEQCAKRVDKLYSKVDRIWNKLDNHEDRLRKLEGGE